MPGEDGPLPDTATELSLLSRTPGSPVFSQSDRSKSSPHKQVSCTIELQVKLYMLNELIVSLLFANMYTVRSWLFQSLEKQNCLPACLSAGWFFWLLEKCPTFLEEHILCILNPPIGRKPGSRGQALGAWSSRQQVETFPTKMHRQEAPPPMSALHQWALPPTRQFSPNYMLTNATWVFLCFCKM